jgi:hypothetical protein
MHTSSICVCERSREYKGTKRKETERNDCISVSRANEYAYVKKKKKKKRRGERTS